MKSRSDSSNRGKYQIHSKIIHSSAFTLVKHPLAQTSDSCSIISNDAIKSLLTKKFKHHLSGFNEKHTYSQELAAVSLLYWDLATGQ